MRYTKTAPAFLSGAPIVAALFFLGFVTANPLKTVGRECSVTMSTANVDDARMVLPWCFGDSDEDDQDDDADDDSLRA